MATTLRAFPALLLTWLATGLGAFGGSVLGNSGGPRGLQAGAIAGGVVGLVAAVIAAKRLGWIPGSEARGAFLGGLLGFAIAIPLTLTNMGTPIVPVLSCGLVGVGALLGAGVSRGWHTPRN